MVGIVGVVVGVVVEVVGIVGVVVVEGEVVVTTTTMMTMMLRVNSSSLPFTETYLFACLVDFFSHCDRYAR